MNGAEKLRLLSVCDKETGVCLFQRAWQWRGEQERSSIGKLVQSFYQFAREVDQGGGCKQCWLKQETDGWVYLGSICIVAGNISVLTRLIA